MKPRELSNQMFGRLTAIRRVESSVAGDTRWLCLCSCGVKKTILTLHLVDGNTKSCGCLRDEVRTTHGQSRRGKATPEYRCWKQIKARCLNPNSQFYGSYGGAGVTMCDRWLNSFDNFFEDMGKRPSDRHSIDRIDVTGNYVPANCRWATPRQQGLNKRNTKFYESGGLRLTLTEWAERTGISPATILIRISRGMAVDKAVSTPALLSNGLPRADTKLEPFTFGGAL